MCKETQKLKFEIQGLLLFFSLITIVTGIFLLPLLTFASQSSCITTDCHSGLPQDQSIHPEAIACESCHEGGMDAHGDDGKEMRLSETMCKGCHEGEQGNYQYPHPPVITGNCYICHDPHGKLEHKLLPEDFSLEQYVAYNQNEYKLCFICHKRDLLMFPDTSFSTDFRDGTKNLHYLHVTKSNRGRNCIVCHDLHGGDQPKMIRDKSQFGDWQMELNFQKNTTGGSCAPGCHRMRSYSK